VRVEDEGIVIVADLPKKVSWDQDRLAAMAERIRAAGDDPTEYLEIAYRVPERRYGAWLRANRTPWKPICWELGISRASANRRWQYGIAVIVWRLNGRSVPRKRSMEFVIKRAL